jgi:hypothetical protein
MKAGRASAQPGRLQEGQSYDGAEVRDMITEAVALAMAAKMSPVSKKAEGRKAPRSPLPDPELELALQVSLKAKVLAMVRTAINDVTPPLSGTAPKGRFMYWDPKEMRSCIDMFIARHADDLADELSYYRNQGVFCLKYCRDVRTTGNNERSVQALTVRKVFLSKVNTDFLLCGKVAIPPPLVCWTSPSHCLPSTPLRRC